MSNPTQTVASSTDPVPTI